MNRLFLLLFVAVSVATHAQIPDYVPTDGLVGWYPFNGNANDESGNGNDGEMMGVTSIPDRLNIDSSAFAFDGASLIAINNVEDFHFQGSFTITCWAKWNTNANGNYTRIISKDLNQFPSYGSYQVITGAGDSLDYCGGTLRTQSNYTWTRHAGGQAAGDWRFIAFTWDGETICISEDNGSNVCNPISGQISYQNLPLNIGKGLGNYGVPNYFDGCIDDVGFWNRALTEEEITALYNAELPILGCTDSTACNFNEEADEDDNSCVYPPSECVDCEFGGIYCGDGTIWDSSLQTCIGYDDCPADLNGNGSVEVSDLLIMLTDFGTECPPEAAEFICGDPVSHQGHNYATVEIGENCWFKENLRSESYENGDTIPSNLSNSEWSSTTLGATAVYGEGNSACYTYTPEGDACDEAWSLNEYGRLYNWHAVNDVRGLCPSGWSIPSDGDWMTMEMALGMSEVEVNSTGWRGTDQGIEMKTDYGWHEDGNGTNSSGFSGMPGGYRNASGFFNGAGENSYWWSSSPDESAAWGRALGSVNDNIFRVGHHLRSGFSVRCVRDVE